VMEEGNRIGGLKDSGPYSKGSEKESWSLAAGGSKKTMWEGLVYRLLPNRENPGKGGRGEAY